MHDRLPSFRGIEAFLYLVKTGGIRATARAMDLSVSAVSNRLRLLEDELGVSLYRRGAKKLELTPSAQTFYDELQPIVGELADAAARLRKNLDSTSISISASSIIISAWLGRKLGNWRKRFPGIQLDILTLDESNEQPSTDIVIRSLFGVEPASDEFRLFRWELSPVCKPEVVSDYKLEKPGDLENVPLLDRVRTIGGWSAWLTSVDLPPKFGDRSLVFDSVDLMLDAAVQGLGVAIGAVPMKDEYRERGLIMPFDATCIIPGGAYVNEPSPKERRVVKIFRNWLLEEANIALCTD